MKKLLAKIRKLLRDRRTRRIITRFVSVTAAIVVFVTTYALVLPAITMESEAYCGIPAHQHDDSCYELQLVCGLEESLGHQHDDSCYSVNQVLVCETEEHEHSVDNGCYDEEGNLICTKAEHTHSADDNCYEEERVLICEEEESEGHQHTDDCYQKVLTCGLEAHTHSTECYVNPDASGATTEAAVEASTGASTGAAAASTGVSSTGATEDDAVEYDFEDGNETAGTGDNSNTGATEASENASIALTTVENAAAGVTADGSYIPQLDPVDFTRALDAHTGIYYHPVADGETVEDSTALTYDQWQRVDKNTELGVNDLLRVYLAYTVPAGSLNATNQVSRYRLPGNLHLTDAQVNAINTNINGIAGQYVNMDTLEILDVDKYNAYLGVEAVEGTRAPSDDPDQYLADFTRRTGKEASEYISALVRVENVFDERTGEYLGQDLVFTWTPYSIEKNQHEYDSTGQPTKAGQEIDGWVTLDFNLSQVDLIEAAVDTFEREVETAVDAETVDGDAVDATMENQTGDGQAVDTETNGEQAVDAHTVETVERHEKTADVVFVAEGRDENGSKIHEISTTLTVVEETVVDVQTVEDQEENTSEDEAGEAAGDTDANVEDAADAATTGVTVAPTEEDKTEADAEPVVIMPAMSFSDSIKVRTGKPADIDISAGGTLANAADSLPEEAEVTVRVEADEGTFPAGTKMVLKAVDQETLDGLADTLAETVENAPSDAATSSDSTASTDDAEAGETEQADSADAAVDDHSVENDAQSGEHTENSAEQHAETEKPAEEEQKNLKTYGFQAVDITFVDAEGNEVEPAKPVRVALTSETVEQAKKDAENSSVVDPVVVHVDDEGNAEQMDLVAPEEIEPAVGRSEEEIERDLEAEKAAESDEADTVETADADSTDTASTADADSTVDNDADENDAAVNDDAASDATVDDHTVDNEAATSDGDETTADTTVGDTTEADDQLKTGEGENPADVTGDAETTDAATDSSTVGFTTDSFSVYAIVYTVDFHYDVDGQTYDYSIKGGDVIGLKELLPVLQVITDDIETENVDEVQTFINDIESVQFSDESLVKVARIDTDTTAGELKEKIKNETGAEPEYSDELTEEQIAEMNAKRLKAVDWTLISLKSFESEESLTISMKSGEEFVVKVTDRLYHNVSGNETPSKGTVFNGRDTNTLDGITITMFDYGPDNSLDLKKNNLYEANNNNNPYNNTGINNGHDLKFYSYGKAPYDTTTSGNTNGNYQGATGTSTEALGINHFSGGTPAVQGIVNETLTSGFPTLSTNNTSLDYLFRKTDSNTSTKTTYKDLTGLFQIGSSGKLYYDSNENYARLNNGWFDLCDTFEEEGSSDTGTFGIGFFPFNDWNSSKTCVHGKDGADDYQNGWWCDGKTAGKNGYYNHHFGMTVEATFTMDDDKDIYFNFSGDDDMWVFVDDVLVLDVGGVHNPVGGRINFKTGDVVVDSAVQLGDSVPVIKEQKSWGLVDALDETRVGGSSATMQNLFANQGKTWNPNDKTTEHTIKVFYLERGGCYSNLKLEFAMPTVTRKGMVEFNKEDNVTHAGLEGAVFGLYMDANCTIPATNRDNVQYTATSHASDGGKVTFTGIPVANNESSHKYYMKEITPPNGYKLSNNVYEVTIVYNGTSTVKDPSNNSNTTSITNEENEVSIKKTDKNGNPLPGATFVLTKYDNSTETFSPNGGNAVTTFKGLLDGTYTITETSAPAGYKSMTGTIRFKIENGIISEVGTHPSNVEWNGSTFTYTVKNEPDVANNEIKVLKKWVDANGNPVDGTQDVTVQLRRKIVNEHTVNVQFHSNGGGSGWGAYQAVDYYSNGHKASGNEITLRFSDVTYNWGWNDANPVVSIIGGSGRIISNSTSNHQRTIVIGDVSTDINVRLDYNSNNSDLRNQGNSIVNSVTVTGNGGGSGTTDDSIFPFNSEAETAKATKILKASENYIASWTFGNGNGYDFPISGSSGSYLYYVVELKNGTVLTPDPNGDELLSISNNDGIATGLITVTNRWTNPTADLSLVKTDGSGHNLAGAVFQLYVDNSTPPEAANYVLVKPQSGYIIGFDGIRFNDGTNGATDVELTKVTVNQKPGQPGSGVDQYSCFTTSDQTMTLKNLPDGRYRLVEVDAPDGYVLTLKPIEFTVASGAVTYDATTTNNAGNVAKVTPTPSDGSNVTQLEIANEVGVELPNSGGPGTRLIYLAGAMLTAVATLLLLHRMKRIKT